MSHKGTDIKRKGEKMDLLNETMVHIKKDGIEYLQFRKLLEYETIVKHCFTLRPLDFGSNATWKEYSKGYEENYKKISRALEIKDSTIIRPYQTHTDVVKTIKQKKEGISIFEEQYKDVDGLITNQKNIAFSLVYADCIPLYFFDPVKRVIANIHSGWKGTQKQIGKKAALKMIQEYECNPKDIICCMGPSIGRCHFEVEEEVKQLFEETFKKTGRIQEIIQDQGRKNGKQKYSIDTVLINRMMLEEVGLLRQNIIESGICTVCNSDLLHSYREMQEKAGRNTAIISLK